MKYAPHERPARSPAGAGARPICPADQNFRAAFEARRSDTVGPVVDDTLDWMGVNMRRWTGLPAGVTADAVLHMMVARCVAAAVVPDAEVVAVSKRVTRLEAAAVLRHAAQCADRARREMTRLRKKHPGDALADQAVKDGACPVTASVLGNDRPLPWDAAHDGHVIPRSTSWAFGLVRYAIGLTREMGERITTAIADIAEAVPANGRDLRIMRTLWEQRRPILMVNGLTPFTVKLVHDMWLDDPSVAVVNVGPSMHGNPFRSLGIPYVEDARGYLKALFACEVFPALVEPRLGGFTVTCSTGLLSFPTIARKRTESLEAIPVWLRTMAEIGLIGRIDMLSGLCGGLERLSPALRIKFYRAHRRLMEHPVRFQRNLSGPGHRTIQAARSAAAAERAALERRMNEDEQACLRALAREAAGKRKKKRKQARTRALPVLPPLGQRLEYLERTRAEHTDHLPPVLPKRKRRGERRKAGEAPETMEAMELAGTTVTMETLEEAFGAPPPEGPPLGDPVDLGALEEREEREKEDEPEALEPPPEEITAEDLIRGVKAGKRVGKKAERNAGNGGEAPSP